MYHQSERELDDLQSRLDRRRQALEQIARKCDGVAYPPQLIAEIAALAHSALGEGDPKERVYALMVRDGKLLKREWGSTEWRPAGEAVNSLETMAD